MWRSLVFLPAGVLLGVAGRRWPEMKAFERWPLSAFLILPPVLLEFLLVWASGRRVWPDNVVLSALFGIAGILWANADWRARKVADG